MPSSRTYVSINKRNIRGLQFLIFANQGLVPEDVSKEGQAGAQDEVQLHLALPEFFIVPSAMV